ncbi:MAG: toxin-antitoxin system TumE family protein [Betaproteobacteria bacterium]
MHARQFFRHRAKQDDVIVDMVIWSLPSPSVERPHALKYRLYCGRGKACIVRYDNEAGKGDHRHYGQREQPYAFESLEKLVADFRNDCARLANWRWE